MLLPSASSLQTAKSFILGKLRYEDQSCLGAENQESEPISMIWQNIFHLFPFLESFTIPSRIAPILLYIGYLVTRGLHLCLSAWPAMGKDLSTKHAGDAKTRSTSWLDSSDRIRVKF